MLLKDLLLEFEFNCQVRKLSPRTVDNYKKQIQYLLNFLEQEYSVTVLEEVEPTMIKRFLVTMTNLGRKPSYVNDLLKAFKCYFKYAVEEEYTDTLLTAKIKNIKEPKVIIHTFTNGEISKMIQYYNKNDFLSVRNKAILCTFFDTGIRLSELTGLEEQQIKDDYIIIHGKGEKERVVPKSPFLAKILFKYLSVRKSYFAYRAIPYNIFLSKNGRPLSAELIERVIKKAGAYAKVNKEVRVSPHTARHTYAQMQLKNGCDLYTLSRLLGHENVSITQRYLEGLKDSEVLAAGVKTSPLMNL